MTGKVREFCYRKPG